MTVLRGTIANLSPDKALRTIEDVLKAKAPDVLRALKGMAFWGTSLRKEIVSDVR